MMMGISRTERSGVRQCVDNNAASRPQGGEAAFITVDLTAINLSLDHTALVLSL